MSTERECDENHPQNFQDLLKISLRLTDQETKEWKSDFNPMDAERMKWLSSAMEAVAGDSDIIRLKKATEILQAVPVRDVDGSDAIQERTNALEEIQYLVESIDNARDLYIVGGLRTVIQYLCSEHSELRYRAAEALAVSVQNNPYCQTAATHLGAVPILILLTTSDHVDIVRVKALYALSGLVKNSVDAEREFMRQNGYEALHVALKSDVKNLRLKSAFLIRGLISQDDATEGNRILELLINDGLAVTLLNLLKEEHDNTHEQFAGLFADVVSRCSLHSIGFSILDKGIVKILEDRRSRLQAEDPDCHREEIESLRIIIEKLS